MNAIPHIRLILLIVAFGPFYWLLNTVMDSILPFLSTSDPVFIILKAGWSIFLYVFLIGVVSHYFIEVRRDYNE